MRILIVTTGLLALFCFSMALYGFGKPLRPNLKFTCFTQAGTFITEPGSAYREGDTVVWEDPDNHSRVFVPWSQCLAIEEKGSE